MPLPCEVQDAITERIEALAPMYVSDRALATPRSSYAHKVGDAWRRSQHPLLPEWEPDPVAHLAFYVDDRDLDALDMASLSAPALTDEPSRAPIVVRFLFELLARRTHEDWQAAATAAAHLRGWLLAAPFEDFTLDAATPSIRRTPTGKNDWLIVEVRFVALYDLNLFPS